MPLTCDQYQDQILADTTELCALLRGNDLQLRVPSCPEWDLGQLAIHVGQAHRWAERIVATRATLEVADEEVPEFEPPRGGDVTDLVVWLTRGAELLVAALRDAGAEARVWSWFADQSSGFWARRMTHETVVHRADACLATGSRFTVAPEVAVDTIDEWLTLISDSTAQAEDEELHELRQWAGGSLQLRATDTTDELNARWLIRLGDDGVSWCREYARADVVLSGPLTEVLRVFYRRLSPSSELVRVHGDTELLKVWLERVSFS